MLFRATRSLVGHENTHEWHIVIKAISLDFLFLHIESTDSMIANGCKHAQGQLQVNKVSNNSVMNVL